MQNIEYKTIMKGDYCQIISKVIKDGMTELDLFADNLPSDLKKHLAGISIIMNEHATQGSSLITNSNCHQAYAKKEIKIYEYRKNRLRVYWFYDKDSRNIVICSHCIVKKSQKTKKEDGDKAIRLFNEYHSNRANITIL